MTCPEFPGTIALVRSRVLEPEPEAGNDEPFLKAVRPQ